MNKWDPSGLAAYFFDGTGNHPEQWNVDGSANHSTNVRKLFDAYIGTAFYAYGVGSGYAPDGGRYTEDLLDQGAVIERQNSELATGGTLHERVNWMLGNLERQLDKGDKQVEVFGFSRGAASALEFLNRIEDKVKSGDPKYQNIDVRFVGLFDAVSSMRVNTLSYFDSDLIVPRRIPGMEALSDPWSIGGVTHTHYRFSLPRGLSYSSVPIHTVAIDEKRKQFQVLDLQGALQVGFRGVHSENGGGYGPDNSFDWQTRDFMVQRARMAGLQFSQEKLDSYERNNAELFQMWNLYERKPTWRWSLGPTDNSNWKYNDNEPRRMPRGLLIHSSAEFYSYPWQNAWSAPTVEFDRGVIPPGTPLPTNLLGVP